jgi:hypothetical protein
MAKAEASVEELVGMIERGEILHMLSALPLVPQETKNAALARFRQVTSSGIFDKAPVKAEVRP